MAKFGIIISDQKVFRNDLIVFDFKKSYFTPDETPAAPSLEFSADNTTWYDVSSKKEISWRFSTAGNQTIYLRMTSTTSGDQTFTYQVEVIDTAAQNLFSQDSDLIGYEPDIMKWLPKYWSSWNIIHLRAQEYILNFLREKAIYAEDGTDYKRDEIQNIDEVRDWSSALALYYIFSGTSNSTSDVFKEKSKQYEEIANTRAAKARISLDYNKNLENDDPQEDLRSVILRRA
jgi:hypothetical protein